MQSNTSATDTGKSVLSTADKADGYVKAYAELYDEIVQGYEDGTREIYGQVKTAPVNSRRKKSWMPWMRRIRKQWTAL